MNETFRPASQKSRRWWRWPLIGCGLGIGFLVALVGITTVAIVLIALPFKEDKVASSLALGESVTIDNLKVTVTDFQMLDAVGGATPRLQGKFLLVHVQAENAGQTPVQEFVSLQIEYAGAKVDTAMGLQFALGTTDPAHPRFRSNVDLFPGATSDGWVGFEVPVGLNPSDIQVLLKVNNKVSGWALPSSR